jgi:hypothetical protein
MIRLQLVEVGADAHDEGLLWLVLSSVLFENLNSNKLRGLILNRNLFVTGAVDLLQTLFSWLQTAAGIGNVKLQQFSPN